MNKWNLRRMQMKNSNANQVSNDIEQIFAVHDKVWCFESFSFELIFEVIGVLDAILYEMYVLPKSRVGFDLLNEANRGWL